MVKITTLWSYAQITHTQKKVFEMWGMHIMSWRQRLLLYILTDNSVTF